MAEYKLLANTVTFHCYLKKQLAISLMATAPSVENKKMSCDDM